MPSCRRSMTVTKSFAMKMMMMMMMMVVGGEAWLRGYGREFAGRERVVFTNANEVE